MKKFLILLLMASFLSLGHNAAAADSSVAPGKVIKGKGNSTVYYVGEDNKRYVFPNDKIYFSWYDDFSEVTEISLDNLQAIPLGGNVHYKPGALLVKIQTDPKVYAVGANGNLRWVKSEAIAKALYGSKWNKLVDDVPDSFFTNYKVGTAIESESDFDPADEADAYDTFSRSKGWKAKKEKVESKYALKQCEHLERSVNQLQKRLARWGMEMPDLGDDFLNTCVSKVKGNRYGVDKIAVCHIPDDGGKPHTIHIAKPAAKAHLAHGDYLGECTDQPNNDPADDTAPEISNISAEAEGTHAVISWTTDEDSGSKIEYSTESLSLSTDIKMVENTTLKKSHSLNISNLATSTKYYYRVISVDAAGNSAVSNEAEFTTLSADPDTEALAISNIQVIASTSTAVITWDTNEPTTGKITYADSSLDESENKIIKSGTELVLSHSFTLTDLASSTTYYYMIESTDAANNEAVNSQGTFLTL
jgi:hypothetical protein